MSKVPAQAKEALGYIKEEIGEVVGSDDLAKGGRCLRNTARIEQGKTPKLTKPGSKKPNAVKRR